MSSLKEQRERLLQAKMREMSNIGVTKRTADNIPDFDEPIDLDEEPTLEEECNAVSETEGTTASTPTTSPQAFQRHSSKRKQSDKEEKKPSSSAQEFAAYEERFLTSVRDGRNKSGFSIHTEVLQLLRNVVS